MVAYFAKRVSETTLTSLFKIVYVFLSGTVPSDAEFDVFRRHFRSPCGRGRGVVSVKRVHTF